MAARSFQDLQPERLPETCDAAYHLAAPFIKKIALMIKATITAGFLRRHTDVGAPVFIGKPLYQHLRMSVSGTN
jgi:hypothetical protein